jgi:DNA-binding XRE family transcriptional regulator
MKKENKLRYLRSAKRMSLRELAVEAGISTSTLVAVEKYSYLPSQDIRTRIAVALGIRESLIWPVSESEASNAK